MGGCQTFEIPRWLTAGDLSVKEGSYINYQCSGLYMRFAKNIKRKEQLHPERVTGHDPLLDDEKGILCSSQSAECVWLGPSR